MVTTDTLVSYYKLEEASGDAIDAHGSNDGTVQNVVYESAGLIDNCYRFNDIVSPTHNVSLGDIEFNSGKHISISCWAKIAGTNDEDMNAGNSTLDTVLPSILMVIFLLDPPSFFPIIFITILSPDTNIVSLVIVACKLYSVSLGIEI